MSGHKTRSETRQEPAFFWQGALIVLPVVIMALIGWRAILGDKATIEQEARQRAGELARDLPERLAPRLGDELTILDLLSPVRAETPGNEASGETGVEAIKDSVGWAVWQSRHPEWQPLISNVVAANILLPRISLDGQGRLAWPREYDQPPHPPAWFQELSGEQRQGWDALQQAAQLTNQPTAVEEAVRRFLSLHPPPSAGSNVDFVRFRMQLPRLEPSAAVWSVRSFARQHRDNLAESGLPLDSLALAEAFRLAKAAQWPAPGRYWSAGAAGGCWAERSRGSLWRRLPTTLSKFPSGQRLRL